MILPKSLLDQVEYYVLEQGCVEKKFNGYTYDIACDEITLCFKPRLRGFQFLGLVFSWTEKKGDTQVFRFPFVKTKNGEGRTIYTDRDPQAQELIDQLKAWAEGK